MSKRKHPSPQLISDLSRVFAKHNWSGLPIGLVKPKPMTDSMSTEDDTGPEVCPDGSLPQTVTYRLPNGDEVTRRICR
jgi:hypothetical protein